MCTDLQGGIQYLGTGSTEMAKGELMRVAGGVTGGADEDNIVVVVALGYWHGKGEHW